MQLSLKKYLLSQALVAVAAGIMFGALLGAFSPLSPVARAVEQTCELAGHLAVGWLQAVTIPLIFSSVVLGGVGLEAMRTMGKLFGKTLAWIVGGNLLAVITAYGIAKCAGLMPGVPQMTMVMKFDPSYTGINRYSPEAAPWTWGWAGLVFLSLGFGYYRNQLDEGHGKLMMRLCQSLEGMVDPLLRSTRAAAAIAIFVLVTASVARHGLYWQAWSGAERAATVLEYGRAWLFVTAGLAYPVMLSLVVWVRTRIGPWEYVPALVPAMLLAAAGQSVEATLPLTMETMRRRIGVSNRVASAVLPLCAALHRDGVALLWVAAMIVTSDSGATLSEWPSMIATGIMAMTLGCGGSALTKQSGFVVGLFVGAKQWGNPVASPLVLGWIVVSAGNAISVFSHACATLIIARSEGEFWVPGPPPNPDELLGLKTDLELADS